MSYEIPATTELFNNKLIELIQALPKDQSILELGSGYTSKIIYEHRGDRAYQALEQSGDWYQDIITKAPHLKEFVTHAPLVSDGLSSNKFYDTSLVTVDNVGLLLIDGPPGGKRWPGAFLCWKFLASEYVIIADDMHRKQYKDALEVWHECNLRTSDKDGLEYFGSGQSTFAIYKGKK